ncbi:hypothetical protein ACF0H5_002248 [Mactra antiquata]
MSYAARKIASLRIGVGHSVFVKSVRTYSQDVKHYKLVVAGAGSGGCAVAARLTKDFGHGNIAVIDPAETHYYQPLWTLVGAGMKTLTQTVTQMKDVIPKGCDLFNLKVAGFDPDNNMIELENSKKLSYDYLIIALGIQINLNKVDGLIEALKSDPMVSSIYLPETVEKTYQAFQKFKGGTAIFTFPNSPIKCAGAPQKIMYLADEYWRKHGVRDKTDIYYQTSLPKIFGVPKYAERLAKVADRKNITVNTRRGLVSVDSTKKVATFDLLDSETGEQESFNYDFLHVSPPMSAPDVFKNSTSSIIDPATGFLEVNKETLQHVKHDNIFGLGDCTNLPTAKTAAAIGCQNKILTTSLRQVMAGKTPDGQYDGYSACPLITSYNTCILAEFDYNLEPKETFPFDQGKERRSMFYLKRDVMPLIYWKLLLKGKWSGCSPFRKMMHLGLKK